MSKVNPSCKFVGFDLNEIAGGAALRFEIRDKFDDLVGTFRLDVGPTERETTDSMLAVGHRRMAEILVDWAKKLQVVAAELEGR